MAPLVEGFHPGYERKGIYSVEEVFAQLGNSWAVFGNDVVPMTSLRYQVFQQSLVCVCCGLKGTYFAKERSAKYSKKTQSFRATTESWHFNLYALTADGREILMTKDHIIPRSKGGADKLENLQTMCRPCNGKKQNHDLYQPVLPFQGEVITL